MATFNGTEGNDTLIGGSAADDLHGFGGNDFMQGGDGADTVLGDGGNDTMSGNGGNDWVRGGTGNDQVSGGGGQDSFAFADFGATNADVLTDFSGSWDNIHLDVSAFTALGSTGRFAAGDARFRLGAAAQDADDRIIYNQATGQLWYDADGNGAGAQQLIATLSNRSAMSATDIHAFQSATPPPPPPSNTPTEGNDSLVGTSGNDTIDGLGGDDTIQGLGGHDQLVGGAGVDSVVGGDGNDTLSGHDGFSERGSTTADTLDGGFGDDVYNVNFSDSIAVDPGGVDQVFADTTWTLGAGLENLRIGGIEADGASGFGNELDNRIDLSGLEHGGQLVGFGGNDLLLGAQRSTFIDGGDGNDTLQGQTSGGDIMLGGNGNDVLISAAGSSFFGNWDTLNGGAGNDTLTGTGFFVFDVAPGAANADVITHFEASDTIRIDGGVFSNIGPSGYFDVNDARFFAAAGATGGHDADDRVVYNTTTGQLFYDADGSGSGAAQLFATLPSGTAFTGERIEVVNAPGRTVNGTEGNDALVGGTSDDTLNGFGGNDTLDGGLGADSMLGGTGDDLYFVDNTGDVVVEGQNAGIDEVRASVSYTLSDFVNNLTLTVHGTGTGNDIDNVLRTEASDTVNLFGLGGNDTLLGSDFWGGNFDGGDGNDEIRASGGLVGGAGNDLMISFNRENNFTGGAGSDTMTGGTAMDVFFQGGENDGHDQISGGAGFDWFIGGSSSQSAIVLNLATGSVTGGGAGGVGSASLTSIEHIQGTPFADSMTGDGGNNVVFGLEGNDTINGGAGNDTLGGFEGVDHFVFSVAPGFANADSVGTYEAGIDKIRLDATAMPALGASGNFTAGDARFHAAAGANAGHDADDRVVYNTSTGQVWYDADGSGAGAAQLIATLQNIPTLLATDIAVDNGSAPPPPPPPPDGTNGTEGNDTMIGTAGSDTLNGLGGNDFMQGQGSADTMRGGAGNDTMGGNDGVDWIEGGTGNDRLSGGSGQDAFVFREFGAASADTLTDFSGNGWDNLRMDNAGFTALGADGRFASGDARFRAGTAAQDADDRIVFNSAAGQVWYDADGNGAGAAQLVATLQAGATLVASDIWVI
jgi:Ca2+-binding RTX toxin-like protein